MACGCVLPPHLESEAGTTMLYLRFRTSSKNPVAICLAWVRAATIAGVMRASGLWSKETCLSLSVRYGVEGKYSVMMDGDLYKVYVAVVDGAAATGAGVVAVAELATMLL